MLLFAACQNTPTPSTPEIPKDAQNAAPNPLVFTPEQVKDADVRAKKLLQDMNKLVEEINATTVSAAKKADLDAIRSQINDGIEKQMMMVKGIEAAANVPAGGTADNDIKGTAVPPPGVLKDYIESIELYNKMIDDFRVQFEALKSGSAKKN